MYKFKIKDKIQLNKNSPFNTYESKKKHSANPNFCQGVITKIDYIKPYKSPYGKNLNISVKWDNNTFNLYNSDDLNLVKSVKNIFNYIL